MGTGALGFSHMKSKVKVLRKKEKQLSYDRLVEKLMKAENTARFLFFFYFFLSVKCVMERFTYFM